MRTLAVGSMLGENEQNFIVSDISPHLLNVPASDAIQKSQEQ